MFRVIKIIKNLSSNEQFEYAAKQNKFVELENF